MDTKKKTDKQIKFSLAGFFKKNIFTGLGVLFPVVITGYFIVIIFRFADKLTGRYINDFLLTRYGYTIPGLGIIIAIAAIFFIGLAYNYFFGKNIFSLFEKILLKVPLISNIYPSAKQLSSFMFTDKEKSNFKKTVLVEFPNKGTYAVGFVTNQNITEFDNAAGEELVCVFIPLAPAPFSGHILAVGKDKIRDLDISVDTAIRFIVSGGVAFSRQSKNVSG